MHQTSQTRDINIIKQNKMKCTWTLVPFQFVFNHMVKLQLEFNFPQKIQMASPDWRITSNLSVIRQQSQAQTICLKVTSEGGVLIMETPSNTKPQPDAWCCAQDLRTVDELTGIWRCALGSALEWV